VKEKKKVYVVHVYKLNPFFITVIILYQLRMYAYKRTCSYNYREEEKKERGKLGD